jgi:hypothetical protein
MDLVVVGYVLHALACSQAAPKQCVELPTRSAPTNLYVCQRAMAVAVERAPGAPVDELGLSGPQHFTFSCEPASPSA